MASATVSFGLVSIPVKLYSPIRSDDKIRFKMLHGNGCGGRLKQQYLCLTDGAIVERKDMVKGYEYAKERFVLFEQSEIKAAEARATQAIEIKEFVPIHLVDPVYLEKPYYVGPDKGGGRPYQLLAKAMRQSGLAGIAQYCARGKQYLVMVRANEEGLHMQHLRYADEVRAFSEVPLGDEEQVSEQELQLALQIIAMSTVEEFRPEQYEDTVQQKLEEMIQKKVDGEDAPLSVAAEPKAQVVDLMAALKASLGALSGDEARKPARRAGGGADAGEEQKSSTG